MKVRPEFPHPGEHFYAPCLKFDPRFSKRAQKGSAEEGYVVGYKLFLARFHLVIDCTHQAGIEGNQFVARDSVPPVFPLEF